jgi:hypothetical protein
VCASTGTPLQAANAGGVSDVFVTKFNAAGSALVYSTYSGGTGNEIGFGVAVDGSGNAYVTGQTNSTNFPTANPLQPTNSTGFFDAFVTKLNAAGTALVYSTYLGGGSHEFGNGIAVDGSGNAYVTGETQSTDFPTCPSSLSVCASTGTPLQSANAGGMDGYDDAFVAKVNTAGSALIYSTYLGGYSDDKGYGIAVDSSSNAYVTGVTDSGNFPTASPLQSTCDGCGSPNHFNDAFVAKLNAAGSALGYSTYLGGSGSDQGSGIAVDGSGNAYVTGFTDSGNFNTASPLQAAKAGGIDAFVAKIGVPSGNQPPILNSIGTQAVNEGSLLNFTVRATDTDGPPTLTIAATGLPLGATFGGLEMGLDGTTGDFSWTPTSGQSGTYFVQFTATDGLGATDTEMVEINVADTIIDRDGDGVADSSDNCPDFANSDQSDSDGDGVGDACDNSPLNPNPGQVDSDGNGVGDASEGQVTTSVAPAPSASESYLPGGPVDLVAHITFTQGAIPSGCIDGGGQPGYLVVAPDPYNVLLRVFDGLGHEVFANQIPEGPGLVLADPSFPGSNLVCIGPTQTLSTTIRLSDWFARLPIDHYTLQATYVNFVTDHRWNPATGLCRPGETECLGPIWQGIAPAPMTFTIGPDLIVYKFTAAPSTTFTSTSITIGDTEMNIGNPAAGPFTVLFYYTTNTANPSSGTLIGSRSLSGLACCKGFSTAINTFAVPPSTPVGAHYAVCAITDSGNAVAEANEGNNITCTPATYQVGPDLIVKTVKAVKKDAKLSITDTVQNNGNQSAGPFTVSFYRSTDPVFEISDTLIGSRPIAGLAGGGASNTTTTVWPTGGMPSGTYYIIAVTDSGNAVTETNENNNAASTAGTSGTVTLP